MRGAPLAPSNRRAARAFRLESHQEVGMTGSVPGKKTANRASKRPAATPDCIKHREELLDDALDDSFPASDPPALSQPDRRRC